jgi:hypothetical protein
VRKKIITLCALLALSIGIGKPAQNLAKEVRAGDFYSLINKKINANSLYLTGEICNHGNLEGVVTIYHSICSEYYCLAGNVQEKEAPSLGSCQEYKSKITPRDEEWTNKEGLKLSVKVHCGNVNEEHQYFL